MKHWLRILFCGSMLLASACNKQPATPQTRPFYLGITPWPADFTTQEVEAAYHFVDEHCDMISHHFDEGIPYQEAYTNQNWPTALLADLQTRKSKTPTGKKILLSSSVLALTRNQKAPYCRYSTTLATTTKQQWELLPFNDARVVRAYTNFMKLLIDTLQPDFINYGVESNEESWNLTTFEEYKEFVSQVYQKLKKAYPDTPILLSFMVNETAQSLNFTRQLILYSDYMALSAYPYTNVSSSASGNTNPALFPVSYFTRFIDLAPGKPLCFAETGYLAQPLSIAAFSLGKQGTASWQDAYLQLICRLVNERKGKFIIWFCHKDYNAGIDRLKQAGVYQDLYGLWADTGLIDENNAPRPAYQTWLGWMNKSVTD